MTSLIRTLAFLFTAALAATPKVVMAENARIQEVVSPGGLTAWLVEEHAIPMVAMEIAFEGGAMLDPEGKRGLVDLAASTLDEGAGDMDAEAFQTRIEELAARIDFDASDDAFGVSFRSLSENLEPSLELMRVALANPRFDQDAVDRVRAQLVSAIKRKETDPQSQAFEAYDKAMWGDDLYAQPRIGTLESVASLTREDLLAVHPRLVDRSRITIAVVGDITAAELAPMLDATFGDLPSGTGGEFAPVAPRETGGVTIIREEIPQSTVAFGHAGILREDPDYTAAYVLMHILGSGGFTGRLMKEVREKNGLAYGVSASLAPQDRGGLITGYVASGNDRVAQAVALIREEWRKMAEEGPSDEEIAAAKKYLTGAFALRFDSNAKIARFLVGAQRSKLGLDYIDRRNGEVEAITADDLRRVAKRILKPDALYFAIVGDPSGLDATE